MKRYLFILGIFFLPITALAEEKTTEITTTIPSRYTLTIPANQEIMRNAETTALSELKVSGELAPDQQVRISATIEEMTNMDNKQAPTLPFRLTNEKGEAWTSDTWSAQETADQKAAKLNLKIEKEAWAKTKPGRYEGKIVFTSTIK